MAFTPAFVLHRRPYHEASALVQLFSWQYGKVSVVARLKAADAGVIQPFIPLLVELKGRSSLKTLSSVEAESLAFPLRGEALYCGFYLNELLYYLLSDGETMPTLYQSYQETLLALADPAQSQGGILRRFELSLLAALGYALPDADSFEEQLTYCFELSEGFITTDQFNPHGYPGWALKQLASFDANDPNQCQFARHFCRSVFDQLLSGRPLRSRELLLRHRAMNERGASELHRQRD